jgi:hypothetical protein
MGGFTPLAFVCPNAIEIERKKVIQTTDKINAKDTDFHSLIGLIFLILLFFRDRPPFFNMRF